MRTGHQGEVCFSKVLLRLDNTKLSKQQLLNWHLLIQLDPLLQPSTTSGSKLQG